MNHDGPQNITDKMRADDGVTQYSRDYWNAYQRPDGSAGPVNKLSAMHETLAEMANLHYTTGKVPGSKEWRTLYRNVNTVHNNLRSIQRKRAKLI